MRYQLAPIDIEPILDWIRANSTDGMAPPRRNYNYSSAAAGLPAWSTLHRRGWTWAKLVQTAGLIERPNGRPPKEGWHPGMSHASIAAEIDRMEATAEPPQPRSWPLFGIPTRCETFIGRLPDGATVRCTRQYFSLR